MNAATKKDRSQHLTRVWGYPSEDGSRILWACVCNCGLSVLDLPSRDEAQRHNVGHQSPDYVAPAEVLFTSQGDRVEIKMTDREAAVILARISDEILDGKRRGSNSFVESLSTQFLFSRRPESRRWSAGQRAWAHKIANEERERAARSVEPKPEPTVRFPRIVAMLTKAAATLKHPSIGMTYEEGVVRVLMSGERSKRPGTLVVVGAGSFESRPYYGRIATDGGWEPARNVPAWVVARLAEFDADPAAAAKLQGQRFGQCCFCSRELTTKESVAAGYGPVCAEKFGLPWGEVPQEQAPEVVR